MSNSSNTSTNSQALHLNIFFLSPSVLNIKHRSRVVYWGHPSGFWDVLSSQLSNRLLLSGAASGHSNLAAQQVHEAICQLSWRSAPVCLLFCLTDLHKAFKSNISCFQSIQISQFTLLLRSFLPKRARAARCWPECAARLLHSINMPSCYSLFNQNTNSLKLIFHHYNVFRLVFMLQICSRVHYNLSLYIMFCI